MSFRFLGTGAFLAALTIVGCSAPNSGGDDPTGGGDDGGQGAGAAPGNGGPLIDPGQVEPPEPVKPPDCDNVLEAIVRDFSREHPDFGGIPYSTGQDGTFIGDVVRRELVKPILGGDKKPDFLDATGCAAPPDSLSEPVGNCANWSGMPEALTTAENFDEWYLETPGRNHVFDKQIELEDQGDGTYVFDTDAFFPLSTEEGFGETMGDASDNITPGRNYLFTTEIHLQFTYVAGQKFTFRGDDDLWVFINNKLALDLGSMHAAAASTIDFDARAEELGIEPGQPYAMDIFHAERRWNGSNFRIETNISCFVPVVEGIIR